MKKTKNKYLLFSIVMLMATIFIGCSETAEEPEPPLLLPNLEGLYVYGSNTIASEPGVPASKVNKAVLDPNQGAQVELMDGVYGKFMYIGANSTIELVFVEDEIGTVYGAVGGGSLDSASFVGGAFKDLTINGTLVADSDPINVTNEGLYYLFVNMNTESFILMEVKGNIIGDATELDWAAGTELPLKSTTTDKTIFEGTEIVLKGATGYRYRFNDGWHVFKDDNIVTLSSLGVLSYGDAWDTDTNDIGFFLDNTPHKESGIFTVTLTYTASTGEWAEVKTKTGDLLSDYSNTDIGWFGNAYYASEGVEGAWDAIHLVQKPVQDENLFNWTWTLELIEGRSFVLRESPDGMWITHGGAGKVGSAFDDELIIKEAPDVDNYYVATGGTYNVTFTINAEDEGRILTIEPN